MYFTKLFVIFGVLLIAVLGKAEGHRRWLKRPANSIRDDESITLNLAIENIRGEGAVRSVEGTRNETEIKYRISSSRWRKLIYNETKIIEGISTGDLNVNSTDNENDFDKSTESRNSRRMKCEGRHRKLNKTIAKSEGLLVTRTRKPLPDNDKITNERRFRKCSGRFGRRDKYCVESAKLGILENIKESNENVLNSTMPS